MPSTKSSKKPNPNWFFDAIGTRWSIETLDAISLGLKNQITKRIATFDATYSRFRDDSLVAKIKEKAGMYEFPEDVAELVRLYERLYELTDGAVTPLVGQSLSALGYDKSYSLHAGAPQKVQAWDDVMRWDGRVITTSRPLELDFGAAGKGYLVDVVASILDEYGVHDFVIDASGDIRTSGQATQIIGLENPYDTTMVIGTVELHDASLCASATNRRSWGNGLHHVIDGHTGKPTEDVVATWVVADSTALADGLATALFFVEPDKLQSIGRFQFVRLLANGSVESSDDFVGQLFI